MQTLPSVNKEVLCTRSWYSGKSEVYGYFLETKTRVEGFSNKRKFSSTDEFERSYNACLNWSDRLLDVKSCFQAEINRWFYGEVQFKSSHGDHFLRVGSCSIYGNHYINVKESGL